MADGAAVYGLLASFDSSERLLQAARDAHARGYRRLDAFSPFPVDGLAETLGFRVGALPWIMLGGALLGGGLGYFMQWYSAVIDYPLNIGGRPLHAWPAFTVITFELTVLGATLAGLVGLLVLNGLPRLHHPVFNARSFQLASRNRFFLLVRADDPCFDAEATRDFLQAREPLLIEEVRR